MTVKALLFAAMLLLPLAGCTSEGCSMEGTLTWNDKGLSSQAAQSHLLEPVAVDTWIHERNESGEWRLINVIDSGDGWTLQLMGRAYGVFLLLNDPAQPSRSTIDSRVADFLTHLGFEAARAQAWAHSNQVNPGQSVAFDQVVSIQNEPVADEAHNGFWRFGSAGTWRYERARAHSEAHYEDDRVAFAEDGRGAWWGPLEGGRTESTARDRAKEAFAQLDIPGEAPRSASFRRDGGACT